MSGGVATGVQRNMLKLMSFNLLLLLLLLLLKLLLLLFHLSCCTSISSRKQQQERNCSACFMRHRLIYMLNPNREIFVDFHSFA